MFSTPHQLELLANARHWYVDATFRLVREPFTQLFTINVFIRSDDNVKQVPLVYVIMFGKSKADYKATLTVLLEQLPAEPRVSTVTADFEAATWKAMSQVLPDVTMHGCVFHLTQAIWRKIQQLGLQLWYNKRQSTFNFCRQLMALAFLPAEFIPAQSAVIERTNPPS